MRELDAAIEYLEAIGNLEEQNKNKNGDNHLFKLLARVVPGKLDECSRMS